MHVLMSVSSERTEFFLNVCRISCNCFSGFCFDGRSLMRRVRVRYVDRIVGLLAAIMVDGDAIFCGESLVVRKEGMRYGAKWCSVQSFKYCRN